MESKVTTKVKEIYVQKPCQQNIIQSTISLSHSMFFLTNVPSENSALIVDTYSTKKFGYQNKVN